MFDKQSYTSFSVGGRSLEGGQSNCGLLASLTSNHIPVLGAGAVTQGRSVTGSNRDLLSASSIGNACRLRDIPGKKRAQGVNTEGNGIAVFFSCRMVREVELSPCRRRWPGLPCPSSTKTSRFWVYCILYLLVWAFTVLYTWYKLKRRLS